MRRNIPKKFIFTNSDLRNEFLRFWGRYKKIWFFHSNFCSGALVWTGHVILMWTRLYVAIRPRGERLRRWNTTKHAKTRPIFQNGKKRFHVRKEQNLKHTLEFCILKNITNSKNIFRNSWFSWIFHFCVFYANFVLYVGRKKDVFFCLICILFDFLSNEPNWKAIFQNN